MIYLSQFPVDTLKLDRSFVQDIDDNRRNQQLVHSVLEMSGSMDLDVVAEGPETEGEIDVLSELDCDEAQGYYFARPMPGEEFRGFRL